MDEGGAPIGPPSSLPPNHNQTDDDDDEEDGGDVGNDDGESPLKQPHQRNHLLHQKMFFAREKTDACSSKL